MNATALAPTGMAAAHAPDRTAFAWWSVFFILVGCTVLQRIAVPAGEFKINAATVIAFGVVGAGLALRRLTINPPALMLYLLFGATALGAALFSFELDRHLRYRQSLPSLIHFVGLYLPFIFRMRDPLDARTVLKLVQGFLIFLAICGLAQFVMQFGGLRLFTFVGLVPQQFLIEELYNVVIPVTDGAGYFKSNGLFLVEPSVASQFVAIALMLELIHFKRLWVLGLLAAAMFVTISGTGLMVIALFLLLYAFSSRAAGRRELLLAIGVVALFALLATMVFEELGNALLARRGEFFDERASGYQRFISPWRGLMVLTERHPAFLLYGVGPGAAETIDFSFIHWVNTPFKLITDFGVPVFLMWFAVFLHAIRRPGNGIIIVPIIYFYFFTGGYHQFGPAIYFVYAMFTLNAAQRENTPAQPPQPSS